MYYLPVTGTDWMLTYLIRESVIGEQINIITRAIINRNLMQSVLTTLLVFGIFFVVVTQNRKNSRLMLEKETVEAENRVKQQELETRLKQIGRASCRERV